MLPEIIAVVHEVIDILAGLKAIDAARQAELHAALESQAPGEESAAPEQPEAPTS